MGRAQRSVDDQGDLFGVAEESGPAPYQVKPDHVRNRLADMVEAMQSADACPWSPSRTKLFRDTVWPYLLGLLPEDEAVDWRGRLEAEASRLGF